MILSIHQPNFFPWMGFFDKLNKSDNFVFLTESLRSKSDKYLTRTKIINNSSSRYLSIPLGIKQIKINQLLMPVDNKWKIKTLNIIHASYRSSKYYEEVIPSIKELIMHDSMYFSDYSINIIKYFVNQLNINTHIHIDTDFNKDFGLVTFKCKYSAGLNPKASPARPMPLSKSKILVSRAKYSIKLMSFVL